MIIDHAVDRIDGTPAQLSDYRGQVLLVVNVASACGLTPQYEGLEQLYGTYKDRGFQVLGFPANEFGAQELGTNEEIQAFCTGTFGVQFPMFAKIVVKGEGQHPLYRDLTATMPVAQDPADGSMEPKLEGYGIKREDPQDVLWNFEKFLIGRDGQVLARFAPNVAPTAPIITTASEQALGAWRPSPNLPSSLRRTGGGGGVRCSV